MSLLQQPVQPKQTQSRQTIRQQVRQLRQQLPAAVRTKAAVDLTEHILSHSKFSARQHFALYLANDAELATEPLINALWQAGKDVYLPVLHPFSPGYLLFIHYDETTALQANRFGIPEPQLNCTKVMPVAGLDIIFTPLVAFDAMGNRLGMGGGFYDRTLSQLSQPSPLPAGQHSKKPDIIGLAYGCQQVAQLPVEAWDEPLDGVITPERYWQFCSR